MGDDDMERDAIIQEVTKRLVEGFHPVAVILFGSQARGDARDESDIDLIVLCDTIIDRNALEGEMIGAMRGIPAPVEVLAFTPQEFDRERNRIGTVAYPASREGKVVYERAA